MTIECTILGMLNREAMAGYDVKKRISDSVIMPWSGNNNQVYKALSALLEEGFVDNEVHHQDGAPSRKVYTITESGRAMLREWLGVPPEPLELKKPFLVQLSLAGTLGARKVDALLEGYERQLRAQLGMHGARKVKEDAGEGLEWVLGVLVDENVGGSYRAELDWVERAREMIKGYVENERGEEEAAKECGVKMDMNYEVMEKNGEMYLYYRRGAVRPETMEATQFVGDCLGHRVNLVMFDELALPEGFYSLRTGVAGELMQKLGQYHVKAALVMDERNMKGKFKDMMIEANRGSTFRSFGNYDEAEKWLIG